jgi:hypothetical protein
LLMEVQSGSCGIGARRGAHSGLHSTALLPTPS